MKQLQYRLATPAKQRVFGYAYLKSTNGMSALRGVQPTVRDIIGFAGMIDIIRNFVLTTLSGTREL